MSRNFYILYHETSIREESDEPYGNWSEDKTITPIKVVYGTIDDVKEELKKTATNPIYFYSFESISLLEEDFDKTLPLYLIYGVYDSGDSFGISSGNVEFLGLVHDKDRANEYAKVINDIPSDEHFITVRVGKKKVDIYVPWNGYFNDLSFMEVVKIEFDVK